ncbi:hypothetical protein BJ741DRAFT_608795 [Chytriomyces cf. hyalinus JEL632]|nr:hypothetical protein BJ741DRAFT_608795 [Chytriomyces cf. hyalinus JEL632]
MDAHATVGSATPEATTDQQGELLLLSGRKYCKHPGCNKHFSTTAHLSRHLLVHSGLRKYKCDYPGCHGAFFRADGLTQHKKTHTKTAKDGLTTDPHAAIHYSGPSVYLVPHMAVTSPVSPNSMPREVPFHHITQHQQQHCAMSPTPPSERPVVMTSRLSSSQGYFHHHHTINGGVTKRNHASQAIRHMSQPTHVASQQYRGGPWILTPVAANHGLPQQYSQHIPVSSSHIPTYRAHPSQQQQQQQPYVLDQDVYLQPVYADGRPVSRDVYFVNVNSARGANTVGVPKMLPSVSVTSQHQGYTVSTPHNQSYSISPNSQSYSAPAPPHHRYSISAQHESSAPHQNYSISAPHSSFSAPHQSYSSSAPPPQQNYSVSVPTQNSYHPARHQEQSFSTSPQDHDAQQSLAPIHAQAPPPTREASPNKTALSFLVD